MFFHQKKAMIFVIGSYFMAELSVTHENQNAMNVV